MMLCLCSSIILLSIWYGIISYNGYSRIFTIQITDDADELSAALEKVSTLFQSRLSVRDEELRAMRQQLEEERTRQQEMEARHLVRNTRLQQQLTEVRLAKYRLSTSLARFNMDKI